MKNKRAFINSIIVFATVLFLSLGYATFSETLAISDIHADVIISMNMHIYGLKKNELIGDATSVLEGFTDNTVYSSISLPNPDSKVVYKVSIVNMGSIEMGLFAINNLDSRLTYSIANYQVGVDKICDDYETTKCSNGSTKDLYLTIGYKDGMYDASTTSFDLNLEFDFQYFHPVYYINIDSSSYPSYIMNKGNLNINLPTGVERIKVTKNSINQINGINYTLNGQALTINNVGGTIRIINVIDMLKSHYVDGSFTLGGLTVTSTSDGIITLNGSSSSGAYVRISDFLRISNTRDELYHVSTDEVFDPIITQNSQIDISVETLSGSHNAVANDKFRFVFRGVDKAHSSANSSKYYDFYTGFFGNGNVLDNIGMASFYINKGITFDNYLFKISVTNKADNTIYDFFPNETITGQGLTIESKGDGTFLINGTSTGVSYIRISNKLKIADNRLKLYESDTNLAEPITSMISAPKTLSLYGKRLAGTMSATLDNQFRLVFRCVDNSNAISSFGYDFVTGVYGSGDIYEDVGMASLYIAPNIVFDNYQFAIYVYEESKDYKTVSFDGLELRLYSDGRYWINGKKEDSDTIYVNLEPKSLKFAASLNTVGDFSTEEPLYLKNQNLYLNFVPILTDGVTFGASSYLNFSTINFSSSTATMLKKPNIYFDGNNVLYLNENKATSYISLDVQSVILIISGPIEFSEFQFYLNRGIES